MDYIKWLILEKNRDFFESGNCIPVFVLNALVVCFAGTVSSVTGLILAAICISIWCIPIFFFAQEAFRKNYNEYQRKRGK